MLKWSHSYKLPNEKIRQMSENFWNISWLENIMWNLYNYKKNDQKGENDFVV